METMKNQPDSVSEVLTHARLTPMEPLPPLSKVSHKVRRIAALRRKAAVQSAIERRKIRQERSKRHILKSTLKPSSGHQSSRPNRHMAQKGKRAQQCQKRFQASLREFSLKGTPPISV